MSYAQNSPMGSPPMSMGTNQGMFEPDYNQITPQMMQQLLQMRQPAMQMQPNYGSQMGAFAGGGYPGTQNGQGMGGMGYPTMGMLSGIMQQLMPQMAQMQMPQAQEPQMPSNPFTGGMAPPQQAQAQPQMSPNVANFAQHWQSLPAPPAQPQNAGWNPAQIQQGMQAFGGRPAAPAPPQDLAHPGVAAGFNPMANRLGSY